jgi:hypothetical protein
VSRDAAGAVGAGSEHLRGISIVTRHPIWCYAAICKACSSGQHACWRLASSRFMCSMGSHLQPRRRSLHAGRQHAPITAPAHPAHPAPALMPPSSPDVYQTASPVNVRRQYMCSLDCRRRFERRGEATEDLAEAKEVCTPHAWILATQSVRLWCCGHAYRCWHPTSQLLTDDVVTCRRRRQRRLKSTASAQCG